MKKLICFLVRIFYKTLYSVEVKGVENIPLKGKLIIASNHISNNDPPLILAFLAKKRLDFSVLAKKELFKNPLFAYIIKKLGAIETDRQNTALSAIKKAINILMQNKCLLIFPEGTRKKTYLSEVKPGISYLVSKTQSDVLPVKISYVKNNNKLGKIIIVFGRVIPTANYDFKNKEIFKYFSQQLMEKIYSL